MVSVPSAEAKSPSSSMASRRPLRPRPPPGAPHPAGRPTRKATCEWRACLSLGASGAPAIRLMGRFALPSGVMQSILIDRLYAWATGITVNGDLPIVLVLKVDREDDGVRMALCTGGMMGERLSEQCALKLAVEAVAGEDTVVSVWLMGGTADERALPDLPLIMTGMQVLLKQLRTEAVADLKRR